MASQRIWWPDIGFGQVSRDLAVVIFRLQLSLQRMVRLMTLPFSYWTAMILDHFRHLNGAA
jgi:hypothetical protein